MDLAKPSLERSVAGAMVAQAIWNNNKIPKLGANFGTKRDALISKCSRK